VVFGAWFSSCWYGVELRVVCLVCGLLAAARKPACLQEPTEWHSLVVSNQLPIPPQSLKVRFEIHKHDQMMYELSHWEHPEKMNAGSSPQT
jgi:hypothetical protein